MHVPTPPRPIQPISPTLSRHSEPSRHPEPCRGISPPSTSKIPYVDLSVPIHTPPVVHHAPLSFRACRGISLRLLAHDLRSHPLVRHHREERLPWFSRRDGAERTGGDARQGAVLVGERFLDTLGMTGEGDEGRCFRLSGEATCTDTAWNDRGDGRVNRPRRRHTPRSGASHFDSEQQRLRGRGAWHAPGSPTASERWGRRGPCNLTRSSPLARYGRTNPTMVSRLACAPVLDRGVAGGTDADVTAGDQHPLTLGTGALSSLRDASRPPMRKNHVRSTCRIDLVASGGRLETGRCISR